MTRCASPVWHVPMAAALLALSASPGRAQLSIDWYTIDGGGGPATGGTFDLTGTIGQPDVGLVTGGQFEINGGFWTSAGSSCYPNCDGSTTPPVLNVLDFTCFLNRFAAGDSYANCDNSTTPPALNVLDFLCFLNQFAAGCS